MSISHIILPIHFHREQLIIIVKFYRSRSILLGWIVIYMNTSYHIIIQQSFGFRCFHRNMHRRFLWETFRNIKVRWRERDRIDITIWMIVIYREYNTWTSLVIIMKINIRTDRDSIHNSIVGSYLNCINLIWNDDIMCWHIRMRGRDDMMPVRVINNNSDILILSISWWICSYHFNSLEKLWSEISSNHYQ